MSFLDRAKQVAGQAATAAAKVGAEVGQKAATTIRDPATKARAESALRKAKRGLTTTLERIDPKILADVVIKATSLQERANASLQERGSVYRIGEIGIGAAIPPSVTFTISRIDDPERPGFRDSSTILAADQARAAETIVSLDGTAVTGDELEELVEAQG
jgi:hypothetical protein